MSGKSSIAEKLARRQATRPTRTQVLAGTSVSLGIAAIVVLGAACSSPSPIGMPQAPAHAKSSGSHHAKLASKSTPRAHRTVSSTHPTPRHSGSGSASSHTSKTSSAKVPGCATANVSVNTSGGSGAMGTLVTQLTVKNVGSSPCFLDGYAGILPYSLSGSKVKPLTGVKIEPIGNFAGIGGPGGRIVLAHGGTAVLWIKWSDVDQPGGCQAWSGLYLTTAAPASVSGRQVSFGSSPGLVCGNQLQISQYFPPSKKIG